MKNLEAVGGFEKRVSLYWPPASGKTGAARFFGELGMALHDPECRAQVQNLLACSDGGADILATLDHAPAFMAVLDGGPGPGADAAMDQLNPVLACPDAAAHLIGGINEYHAFTSGKTVFGVFRVLAPVIVAIESEAAPEKRREAIARAMCEYLNLYAGIPWLIAWDNRFDLDLLKCIIEQGLQTAVGDKALNMGSE